ncbi:response regulator [bacterium]|nr:response regulator [bacterium]
MKSQLASQNREITAWKKVSEKYRGMFENAVEGFFQTSPEGRFILVNPAVLRMLRYETFEDLSQNIQDIPSQLYLHPEQRRDFITPLEKFGFVKGFELQAYRKDKTVMWASLSARAVKDKKGKVLYLEGTAEDITPRKEAEENLRRNYDVQTILNALLSLSLENVSIDALLNKILETLFSIPWLPNRQGALFLAGRQSGIFSLMAKFGTSDLDVCSQIELGKCVCGKVALSKKMTFSNCKNKSYRHYCIPILYEERTLGILKVDVPKNQEPTDLEERFLTSVVRIVAGIIVRKQAKEATLESHRRLEETIGELIEASRQTSIHQERLRVLGVMASGIAHDFSNVLTPILGFTDLLLSNYNLMNDKEKFTRYLKLMKASVEDAINVVSRLRNFYRHNENPDFSSSVNLNLLVKQVGILTQPRWKNQAQALDVHNTFKTELEKIPNISVNKEELREALTNLIFNAVDAIVQKFSENPNSKMRKGTIVIRTEWSNENREITLNEPESMVSLEIIDSGVGMTQEVRRRCLEPFFSTKGESGTGLGLSLVYETIKKHHGSMEIESEPNKGSKFIIKFPPFFSSEKNFEEKKETFPKPLLNVLVVDDEPMVREMMVDYLSGEGYTVETASNGFEGLKRFKDGKFDLVITDRAMPEMSGDQMASRIKNFSTDTKVIMLTGFHGVLGDLKAKPEEIDLILSKPISLSSLREAVLQVIPNRLPVVRK